MEIRSLLFYGFKFGLKATKAAPIKYVFGEDIISERRAQFWFSKFHSGDKSLLNDP